MRNCYTAALNAGGRPSGAPSYRNNDCSCFNAAVEDLDGNTIEFIFREQCESETDEVPALSTYSRASERLRSDAHSAVDGDRQSVASKASKVKSRAQTAVDLASTTSRSMKKSEAPTPGLTRSYTAPATTASASDNGGRAIVGTLLGAAAGAAMAYAMCKSEQDNARDEAVYANSMQSKALSSRGTRTHSNYERSTVSKDTRRDYSTKESVRSSQHPSRSILAIESAPYDNDEIQEVISRYASSRRSVPQRSNTYDAIEYAPMSRTSGRIDRSSIKRASTMPIDMPQYLLEGPRTELTPRHTSREAGLEDSRLKRHDSGVSVHSHRSRHSFEGGRSRSASRATTIKSPRRASVYQSAANMRPSKASSYISAADKPLPPSRAMSYVSAAQVKIPPSYTNGGYTDAGEESDGLGDMKTVVPDDSISCIDFNPKKSESGRKSSRYSSKRSEAPSERTVRPAKPSASRHSAQTLPVRSKDEYYNKNSTKRSTYSYV